MITTVSVVNIHHFIKCKIKGEKNCQDTSLNSPISEPYLPKFQITIIKLEWTHFLIMAIGF